MMTVNQQACPANVQELTVAELDEVNGGIVPIVLAAAVLCTTVQFSFVVGVFAGSHER